MKESRLQELICQNIGRLLPAHFRDVDMSARVVGREVILPSGRIDILAWRAGETYVIELKAGEIKERDVAQVLRYTYDARRLIVNTQWVYPPPADQPEHITNALEWLCGVTTPDVVCPVIVGSSITDRAYVVAKGAGVIVYLYTAVDDKLTSLYSPRPPEMAEMTGGWLAKIAALNAAYLPRLAAELVLRNLNRIIEDRGKQHGPHA